MIRETRKAIPLLEQFDLTSTNSKKKKHTAKVKLSEEKIKGTGGQQAGHRQSRNEKLKDLDPRVRLSVLGLAGTNT